MFRSTGVTLATIPRSLYALALCLTYLERVPVIRPGLTLGAVFTLLCLRCFMVSLAFSVKTTG